MFLAGGISFGVGMFVMTVKLGLSNIFEFPYGSAIADAIVTFGFAGVMLISGTMTGAFAAFLGGLVYSLLMWIAESLWKRKHNSAKP